MWDKPHMLYFEHSGLILYMERKESSLCWHKRTGIGHQPEGQKWDSVLPRLHPITSQDASSGEEKVHAILQLHCQHQVTHIKVKQILLARSGPGP